MRDIAEDAALPWETTVLAEGSKDPIIAERKILLCFSSRTDGSHNYVKPGMDNLNTHKSEALVRLVTGLEGMAEEGPGVKGRSGILQSMKSREEYLMDQSHKVNQNVYCFGGCSKTSPAGYPKRKTVIIDQTPSRIYEREKCILMLNNTGWQKTTPSSIKIWDYVDKKFYDALTTGDFLTCFYGRYIRVVEVLSPSDSGKTYVTLQQLDDFGFFMGSTNTERQDNVKELSLCY